MEMSMRTFLRNEEGAKHNLSQVLVVEDETHWQFLIGETLKSKYKDVNLRFARSASFAKNILDRDGSFDLIVADYALEGDKTGLDLWKDFSVEYPDIPFVMLSGFNKEEIQSKFSGENFPNYISKMDGVDHLQEFITHNFKKNLVSAPEKKKKLQTFFNSIFISNWVLAVIIFARILYGVGEKVMQENSNTSINYVLNSPESLPGLKPVMIPSAWILQDLQMRPEATMVPLRLNDRVKENKLQPSKIDHIVSLDVKNKIAKIVARADDAMQLLEKKEIKKTDSQNEIRKWRTYDGTKDFFSMSPKEVKR